MEENRRELGRTGRLVAQVIGVLALVGASVFVFFKLQDAFDSDVASDSASAGQVGSRLPGAPTTARPSGPSGTSSGSDRGSDRGSDTVSGSGSTPEPEPTLAASSDATTGGSDAGATQSSSTAASDSAVATTDASSSAPTTTDGGPTTTTSTTRPTTTTTDAPTTTATQATTTTTADGAAPYATLPDGSPVPIIAVFDAEKITIGGAVPSQAAKDHLAALALANSKFPDVTVENLLTINPNVPTNVGARVIELTSVRFPSGSAEVLPDHAAELDRVARVMAALPHVTVLVIGHADQVGAEGSNFELSEQRAAAVVRYLVSQGVAPGRLASRGVGEQDLLSINSDETSLALNRRTEFIFYGLIAGI